eukprot:GAFH01001584.1.p3 GENE.GAFH01001584.1~~GAFH01001584.1.p3  ORF type:complete len:174 (-),score=33.54 GAFH01001584.1:557-1078(-)
MMNLWRRNQAVPGRAVARMLGSDLPKRCWSMPPDQLASVAEVAARLEEEMFADAGGLNSKYTSKFMLLSSNLTSNGALTHDLLSGHMTPERLAVMSHIELAPEHLKSEREKWAKHHANESLTGGITAAVTEEFRCGKCGKRRCSYTQKQTRSADEPMTTFVVCLECGHRWKFS